MKYKLKDQFISFSLPVVVLALIPVSILYCTGGLRMGRGRDLVYDVVLVVIGIIVLAAGLY